MNEPSRRANMPRQRSRAARPPASTRIRDLAGRLSLVCLLLMAASCVGGGQVQGSIRAESLGEPPAVLNAEYVSIVYFHDPNGETSFLLTDVPARELLAGDIQQAQVMHVQLLWQPKAGATPMDATATNATIRHVIVVDGEVGIYGGAGFALPNGKLGHGRIQVALRDATVRLLESTDGFQDPLTPARITGNFTAENDPQLARKVHRAISQLVTTALGRTRFVLSTEANLADVTRGEGI
jgi:hypothetical protein